MLIKRLINALVRITYTFICQTILKYNIDIDNRYQLK